MATYLLSETESIDGRVSIQIQSIEIGYLNLIQTVFLSLLSFSALSVYIRCINSFRNSADAVEKT